MKKLLAIFLLSAIFCFGCAENTNPAQDITDDSALKETDGQHITENITPTKADETVNLALPDDNAPLYKAAVPVVLPVYPEAIAFNDYKGKNENRAKNAADAETSAALKNFSGAVTSKLIAESSGNVTLSPLSLYMALGLCASGAGGKTAEEFASLLGTDGLDEAKINERFKKLFDYLYTDEETTKVKPANSLWLGEKIKFNDKFLENAGKNFYASVFSTDFSNPSAGGDMDRWISESTGGLLSPALSPLPETIMTLINTVYFRDEWVDAFKESENTDDIFTSGSGETLNCTFMNGKFSARCFKRGEGYTMASLPLKSGAYIALALPDNGRDIKSIADTPEKLTEIFTTIEYDRGLVNFKIPKFDCSSSYDLTSQLKALGLDSAFGSDADFSGITDGAAFISTVAHGARVAVDEKGVTAAAYTEIVFAEGAPPEGEEELILDRPFIYQICAEDGTVLFAGVVDNPAE